MRPEKKADAVAHILLIEDEAVLRMTFKYALERHGYAVTTAQSGREGMECCRSVQPDLIVSDLFLPDNEGFKLIEILHREYPAIEIIAMSGIAGPAGQNLARQLGASAFVAKPIDTSTFMRFIARYFEKKACLQESPKGIPGGGHEYG